MRGVEIGAEAADDAHCPLRMALQRRARQPPDQYVRRLVGSTFVRGACSDGPGPQSRTPPLRPGPTGQAAPTACVRLRPPAPTACVRPRRPPGSDGVGETRRVVA